MTTLRDLLTRQREYGVLALLLLTLAVVGAINPAFLKIGNLRDMLVQDAPVVIVACGMTLVVVLGEIDISVGSQMALLATVLGLLTSPSHAHWPVATAVAAALGLGTLLGLINGLLVTFGRMPSIIVTLGMLTVLRGVSLALLNGQDITDLPVGLRVFGIGTFLGLPISLCTALDGRPNCGAGEGNTVGTAHLRGGQQPGSGPIGGAANAAAQIVCLYPHRISDGGCDYCPSNAVLSHSSRCRAGV